MPPVVVPKVLVIRLRVVSMQGAEVVVLMRWFREKRKREDEERSNAGGDDDQEEEVEGRQCGQEP